MQNETLKLISDVLADAGIPYDFMEYKKKVASLEHYWVGEYQEIESINEDGQMETQFILTGTGRSFLILEVVKQQIMKLFPKVSGRRATLDNGSTVAIFYGNAFNVPTGDAMLKRMQINLVIKEWKVEE